MATPLLPFARKGIPAPYLITPCTSDEAASGKATLIAIGDLDPIIAGLQEVAPERADLVAKFANLKDQ